MGSLLQASCKLTNSVLAYAEKEGISLVSVLEGFEEPEEFLEDPHYWVPIEKMELFFQRTSSALNEERLGAFIGSRVSDIQSWGALDSVFKMMTSLKDYYTSLPKFFSYFISPLDQFREVEKGDTFVRFIMPLTREQAPHTYDFLIAMLENLPKYGGHMPVRIDHVRENSEVLISWDTAQPSLFGEEPGQVLNPRLVMGLTNQLDTLEKTLEGKNRQILQLKGEIERLQVSLESQGRGLGLMQLASGVAHEINNPLSYVDSNLQRFGEYFLKITGYLKSLEGQLEFVDEKAFHAARELKTELDLEFVLAETPVMLNEAKDGINRVKEIVKDLVALARPEQVSREIKSPTDLNSLIESTLRVLSAKITPGVKIEKHFGLKERVPVFPVRLSQALMNLVSNGLQALDGEGTLLITTRREGESALIEVQDDGPGISQEVLAQIFLPFFTTKEAGKGSGLGLSIARSFVEMHRGELVVTSQLGEGARFLIRIPIDDTDTQTSMLKSTNPQHEVFH